MIKIFNLFSGVGGLCPRFKRARREDADSGGRLPQIFEHEGMNIRVKMIDGEPWFCLADICRQLELDASQVIKRLEDGVVTIHPIKDVKGRTQQANFVNEDGMYDTILESRKPQARKFRKWITGEVLPSIRKTGGYNSQQLPDFIQRLRLNYNQVPRTHFSVLNELYQRVYLQFEKVGYILPDIGKLGRTLMPDISVGKCFAQYLHSKGYDWTDSIKYKHRFADGRVVDAYAYPNEMLPAFIAFVNEEWLPNKAHNYLKDKDPKALQYLPKLLASK